MARNSNNGDNEATSRGVKFKLDSPFPPPFFLPPVPAPRISSTPLPSDVWSPAALVTPDPFGWTQSRSCNEVVGGRADDQKQSRFGSGRTFSEMCRSGNSLRGGKQSRWEKIEIYCCTPDRHSAVASAFRGWGVVVIGPQLSCTYFR